MKDFVTLSSYFQDFFDKATLRPIEVLVQEYSYTDPYGNTAKRVEKKDTQGPISTEYFVNDKPQTKLPKDILDEMVLDKTYRKVLEPLETLPPPLIEGTTDLKLNMIVQDDSMDIVLNVAGVDPNNIEVSYSGVYLNIKIQEEECKKEPVYLVKGLTEAKGSTKQIYIDENKFSIKNLKVSLDNGLLHIMIPFCKTKETTTIFPLKVKKEKMNKPLVSKEDSEKDTPEETKEITADS